MRAIGTWKRTLVKRLVEETGALPREINRLCDVELGLSLLGKVAPGEPASAVPAVLSGFVAEWRFGSEWSEAKRQMVAVSRQLLQYYQGRRRWEEAIEDYLQLPVRLRLFEIEQSGSITALDTSVCPERVTIYQDALGAPPRHSRRHVHFAEPGKTYFYKNEERWVSVAFPEWSARGAQVSEAPSNEEKRGKTALYVPWREIEEEAAWMDERSPGRNWLSSIKRIALEFPIGKKNASAFEISDTTHMVGIVGAGKSTLMEVLTVWAVHKGLRVTLVVGDVPDAMKRASLFKALGIKAAPILGASDRARHMSRARRIFFEQDRAADVLPDEDARSEWISPVCLLDALSQDWPPVSGGEEPCDSLFEASGGEKRESRFLCPFIMRCPVHKAENEMSDADVWIATPASLIYTKVPTQVSEENLRILESVYRRSDLVVVDEADRVQLQFDDVFGSSDVLIGSDGKGWLDRLRRLTASLPGGRGQLTLETNRWSQAQHMTQQAADLIYALVNEIDDLKPWVKQRDYFTAWSLFLQLRVDICGDLEESDITNDIMEEISAFLEDPIGENKAQPLSSLARGITAAAHANEVRQQSREWIEKWLTATKLEVSSDEAFLLENKLILATATAVLEERLKTLVDHWDIGESAFGLETESEWFFRRPPRDYQALMPEAPMGNLFGFRFERDVSGEKSGTLQFFRLAGVGRWLLTHLHDLFQALDGEKGPSVLLLSATSWAPGSKSFHLSLHPAGILHPPDDDLRTIAESELFFAPTIHCGKPVVVSGRRGEERLQNLERIVTDLAVPARAGELSRLEAELRGLPEGRQRALLVVGSYVEAAHVGGCLRREPVWKDDVLALIRDDEYSRDSERALRRGVVHQFARRSERILVAPLLAIERGHNILTTEGEGAIGSIYFLIRPMPLPFSLSTAVQGINHWTVNNSPSVIPSDSTLAETWRYFRNIAMRRWHVVLSDPGKYRDLTPAERDALCWTQLVFLWQTMGRAVRKGVSVRVFFCDAAFAPETAKGNVDRPSTSLLLGMRDVLSRYQLEEMSSEHLALAKTLYGPLESALSHIAGLDQ